MLSDEKQWSYRGKSCSNIQGIIASLPQSRWKNEIAKVPAAKRKQVRSHLVDVYVQKHGKQG